MTNWTSQIGRDLTDFEKEILTEGEKLRNEALVEALKLRKANLLAEVEAIVKEIEAAVAGKHPASQPNAVGPDPTQNTDGAPIAPGVPEVPEGAPHPEEGEAEQPEEVHGAPDNEPGPAEEAAQEAAEREGGAPAEPEADEPKDDSEQR